MSKRVSTKHQVEEWTPPVFRKRTTKMYYYEVVLTHFDPDTARSLYHKIKQVVGTQAHVVMNEIYYEDGTETRKEMKG